VYKRQPLVDLTDEDKRRAELYYEQLTALARE